MVMILSPSIDRYSNSAIENHEKKDIQNDERICVHVLSAWYAFIIPLFLLFLLLLFPLLLFII